MRVLNIHTFVIVLFMFVGCQPQTDISFLPFQSFDEFGMTEVVTDSVLEPYLLIQRTKDTIKIVRSDQKTDTMVYLNKGEYWYSSVQIKYEYTWWSKLLNKIYPTPAVFGYDIHQVDVYRYHKKDTITEVFFYDMFPNNICVHNRHLSKIYTISEYSSDSILFDLAVGNILYDHYVQDSSACIAKKVYKHNAAKDVFIEYLINANEDTIPCDTIQLNNLGLYHVPTYLFSVENGNSITSVSTNRKMRVCISCTTLETNRF